MDSSKAKTASGGKRGIVFRVEIPGRCPLLNAVFGANLRTRFKQKREAKAQAKLAIELKLRATE